MTQAVEVVAERSTTSRVASALLVIGGGLAWAVGLGILAYDVPRFEGVFKKFDIPGGLPWLTDFFINLAKFIQNDWPIVAVAGLLLICVLALACVWTRRRWGLVVSITFATVSVAAVPMGVMVMFHALLLPMMKLIDAVGRTGH